MAGGQEIDNSRDVGLGPASSCDHRELADFGLVIGVDHYPRFRSLRGAVDDARRVHQWLCDPEGAGIAAEHARLVVSTPSPAAPLQDQVDDTIIELMTQADRLGGGRRLYFYFSGHGAASPGESGDDVALLLAKWSCNLARLALSTDEYQAALSGVGLFQELTIFLDCCRTAAVGAVGLPPTITFKGSGARCATRVFIAYASEAGTSAFERGEDGQWQGVFTRCLLTILRRSQNGISAAELKNALEREVQAASPEQRAHVVNGLFDEARFGRRRTLPQLHIVHQAGRVTVFGGHGELIDECDGGAGVWQLSLAPGLYKAQDETGRSVLIDHDKEVTVVAL